VNDTSIRVRIPPLPPIILGLALVACALIVRSTLIEVKGFGRTLQVTGAAFKPITSDFALWEATLHASAVDLTSAYSKLDRDVQQVRAFMAAQGFGESDYKLDAVQIGRHYDREGQPTAYVLSQSLSTQSSDIARITALSTAASGLIAQGVELASHNPRYVYTKLEEAKIEMIRAATENAKLRAEQLARTAGKSVGAPMTARIGVFQIRPLHSQEVSDYGINDVTSVEKEIVCTVTINFLVE